MSDGAASAPEGDVSIHYQCPALQAGDFSTPFRSLVVDLKKDEVRLLAGLDRDTRYEVKRAQSKDPLRCEFVARPSAEDLRCFQQAYTDFAAAKGLAPIAAARMQARLRAGVLRLSRVSLTGETLAWHCYIVRGANATLLYSVSLGGSHGDSAYRALAGRANRLLHWEDMLQLQGSGCHSYDFGGWYAGTENEQLLRINKFKEGFGGQRVEQCHAYTAHSALGRLYIALVRRRHRQ
jgi:lipid II:glycine glycyltransferase (peptidoglycan interpeptide bridge formation enzyme)